MATPFRWGDSFYANTIQASGQGGARVSALADGRFVVSWNDQSDGAIDVRMQIFNADGSLDGRQLTAHGLAAPAQSYNAVAGLDDGRFVMAWFEDPIVPADPDGGIACAVFDPDGTVSNQGGRFIANQTKAENQSFPDVAALPDGGFVVVWRDDNPATDGDSSAIVARHYGEDGAPRGDEFVVNTTTADTQSRPAVSALDTGGFVITWTDASGAGGEAQDVRAQIFGADGAAVGGEFVVGQLTDGDQNAPDVTGLTDGRFVVTWTDEQGRADDPSWAVRAQIFGADGSLEGETLLANGSTDGFQDGAAITALADGGFLMAWRTNAGGAASEYSIVVRAFDADGSPRGEDVVLRAPDPTRANNPELTTLPDGRVVVVWDGVILGQAAPDEFEIAAQIIDPRTAPVNLAGSMLDDQLVGTGWGDRIAGFVGDDWLIGGAGDDRIEGEDGADILGGGWGNDRLLGGDGDDVLAGQYGHDRLYGGDGNDELNGGLGLDFMAGGAGNDRYVIDRGGDMIVEAANGGADTAQSERISVDLRLHANVEHATLTGTADLNAVGTGAANRLIGNDGENRLIGLGGNDRLIAGAGNDTLIGGLGRDVMTGGAGADTFEFNRPTDSETGALRDIITDFEHGVDTIDLAAIDAATGAGNQAFTFIGGAGFSGTRGELRVTYTAAATIIQADRNGDGVRDFEILLQGLTGLDAGDFIL